jgi:hypothetical protein
MEIQKLTPLYSYDFASTNPIVQTQKNLLIY